MALPNMSPQDKTFCLHISLLNSPAESFPLLLSISSASSLQRPLLNLPHSPDLLGCWSPWPSCCWLHWEIPPPQNLTGGTGPFPSWFHFLPECVVPGPFHSLACELWAWDWMWKNRMHPAPFPPSLARRWVLSSLPEHLQPGLWNLPTPKALQLPRQQTQIPTRVPELPAGLFLNTMSPVPALSLCQSSPLWSRPYFCKVMLFTIFFLLSSPRGQGCVLCGAEAGVVSFWFALKGGSRLKVGAHHVALQPVDGCPLGRARAPPNSTPKCEPWVTPLGARESGKVQRPPDLSGFWLLPGTSGVQFCSLCSSSALATSLWKLDPH